MEDGLFLLLTRLLAGLFLFVLEEGDGRTDNFIGKIRIAKLFDEDWFFNGDLGIRNTTSFFHCVPSIIIIR